MAKTAVSAHERIDELVEALNLVLTSMGVPAISLYIERIQQEKRDK